MKRDLLTGHAPKFKPTPFQLSAKFHKETNS